MSLVLLVWKVFILMDHQSNRSNIIYWKLQNNNQNGQYNQYQWDEDVEYFIGPYCADQGMNTLGPLQAHSRINPIFREGLVNILSIDHHNGITESLTFGLHNFVWTPFV